MTVSVPNLPAYRMGRSVSAPAFFKSTKVCAQRKAKLRAMRDIPTDPIKNDSAMYQRELLLELNAYHANPCYRHRKRRMGNPGKPGRDHHNDSTATMCDRNGIACKPLRRNRYVRTLLPQGGLQRDSPCPHLTRLAARGNCCRRRRLRA